MQNLGEFEGTAGGLFTYGAIDTTNCGAVIAYAPLTSATHYQFKISAIGMGNYTHAEIQEAASDTGGTLIGGPRIVTDQLAKMAGAMDLYTIKCNATPPTIDITIGTNKYCIEHVNYIIKTGGNKCYFALRPLEYSGFRPNWILGRPFIHQFCNIFDIGQKRIGFAPSFQK